MIAIGHTRRLCEERASIIRLRDGVLTQRPLNRSNVGRYISLLESMARAHSSTVMWDALSSLPPLRLGVKLVWGLLQARFSTLSVSPTLFNQGSASHGAGI